MSQYTQTILVNGLMLADPDSCRVTRHHMTLIEGNAFHSVNVPLPADGPSEAAFIVNCTDCLIMPGLVNAHNHAAMSLLRGAADDLSLDDWLQRYIFPAEARFVDPEFVRLGSLISAAESALCGVTTTADGYFFMEECARSFAEVGLRVIAGQGVLEIPTPDCPEPGKWPQRVEEFLSQFPSNPLATPALFCHSPYLCSPELLTAAKDLCRKKGMRLFIHAAETAWEVSEIVARHGTTPIRHLHDLGLLDGETVAVHCVYVSDAEIDILAQTGTPVVHCPESNMKLASGAAPLQTMLSRGVTMALGTDGPASNNNLDMFEEMRSASLLAKVTDKRPDAASAEALLRMATRGGAEALGLGHTLGAIQPGFLADFIVIDLNKAHFMPLYNCVSALVYTAKGSDVRDVFVHGRPVVRDGRLAHVDEADLRARGRAISDNVADHLGILHHGAFLK